MKILYFFTMLLFLLYSCRDSKTTQKENLQKNINSEEKYIEKDKDGLISIEGSLLNGKKNGVWKYFDKGSLIDVKRFKNDSLLYVLDNKDYIFKEIFIEKINSYIPIPSNWETNTNHESNNFEIHLTSVKNCNDSIDYCPNIVLTSEKLLNNDFENYISKYKEEIENSYDKFYFNDLKTNNLKTEESYILTYFINYNNVDIAFLTIFFKENDKVVVFTAASQKNEFDRYIHLFLQIGNSITKKK
jgi:hypothetical protein